MADGTGRIELMAAIAGPRPLGSSRVQLDGADEKANWMAVLVVMQS